jgi:hypothetical protein
VIVDLYLQADKRQPENEDPPSTDGLTIWAAVQLTFQRRVVVLGQSVAQTLSWMNCAVKIFKIFAAMPDHRG